MIACGSRGVGNWREGKEVMPDMQSQCGTGQTGAMTEAAIERRVRLRSDGHQVTLLTNAPSIAE